MSSADIPPTPWGGIFQYIDPCGLYDTASVTMFKFRDGQVTFKKKLPLIWSPEWVELSAESYPLPAVLSGKSCPLATKVTLKIIH